MKFLNRVMFITLFLVMNLGAIAYAGECVKGPEAKDLADGATMEVYTDGDAAKISAFAQRALSGENPQGDTFVIVLGKANAAGERRGEVFVLAQGCVVAIHTAGDVGVNNVLSASGVTRKAH